MNPSGPVALVVNPHSTRASPGLLTLAEQRLGTHGLVSVAVPRDAAATRAAVGDAVEAGARVVAVMGGDGTVGLAAAELADTDVSLLPLPAGSTNVLARGLGWRGRPRQAIDQIDAALSGPRRRLVLGRVSAGDRVTTACVNTGIGVDADAVRWVEGHPRTKHALRQLAFAGAVARAGMRLRQTPSMDLRVGDAPSVPVHALVAAWGRPYAYVGPQALDVLPEAAWDGRAAWIALTRPSPLQTAGVLVGGLLGLGGGVMPGTIGGITPGVITLTSETPFAVQVDGEALDPVSHLQLSTGPVLLAAVPPVRGTQVRGAAADN